MFGSSCLSRNECGSPTRVQTLLLWGHSLALYPLGHRGYSLYIICSSSLQVKVFSLCESKFFPCVSQNFSQVWVKFFSIFWYVKSHWVPNSYSLALHWSKKLSKLRIWYVKFSVHFPRDQGSSSCWRYVLWSLVLWYYLPNPSARAGYDTRSIFKRSLTGLNSEFSFS